MPDIPDILSPEVLSFITEYAHADIAELILKYKKVDGIDIKVIANQIQGRRMARSKFPFLLEYDQFIYPPKVSLEQATSELLARYKGHKVQGKHFCDLTGGMGLDTYFMGRNFEQVDYVEKDPYLCQLAQRNFAILGLNTVTVHHMAAEEFLEQAEERYDLIYIDPSRRIGGQRKTSIRNLEPDVVSLQSSILAIAKNCLVKLSPMQDIAESIKLLPTTREVMVIGLENEVKELLIKLGTESTDTIPVHAVILDKNHAAQELSGTVSAAASSVSSRPAGRFLYLPHSVILKAALHDDVADEHGLDKLHPNTHIYTSDTLASDYPGRILEVIEVTQLNKKVLRPYLQTGHINVITKNFPLSAVAIKKKLSVQDGGSLFLVAYTDLDDKKRVAICRKATI